MANPYPGVPAPGGRRWKRRHTIGCFGTLILIVVLGVGIQVLFTPWAYHLGGRFSPSMKWSGVAVGTAPRGGGTYAVRLNLRANNLAQHDCSSRGCDDFAGTMEVCTAAGEFSFTQLSGTVGGWLTVNGQKMHLDGRFGTTAADRGLLFVFDGVWHGQTYQASDDGYLVYSFNPDGTPRAGLTSAHTADAVPLAFRTGDFTKLCQQVKK
jgi:hypothetical protein